MIKNKFKIISTRSEILHRSDGKPILIAEVKIVGMGNLLCIYAEQNPLFKNLVFSIWKTSKIKSLVYALHQGRNNFSSEDEIEFYTNEFDVVKSEYNYFFQMAARMVEEMKSYYIIGESKSHIFLGYARKDLLDCKYTELYVQDQETKMRMHLFIGYYDDMRIIRVLPYPVLLENYDNPDFDIDEHLTESLYVEDVYGRNNTFSHLHSSEFIEDIVFSEALENLYVSKDMASFLGIFENIGTEVGRINIVS